MALYNDDLNTWLRLIISKADEMFASFILHFIIETRGDQDMKAYNVFR